MFRKLKTFLLYWRNPSVSRWFLFRYALGQTLAYLGIGQFIAFKTPHYKLLLTKSPVAMVMFGDPKYERHEETVLTDILQTGDTVLDIGANNGTFSLQAGFLVGNSGQVFAFEGHPVTANILKKNVELNRLSNINVSAVAVGDINGYIRFSEGIYDDVNHVVSDNSGISVPIIRIDDFIPLSNLPRIRCMNLDVEGYELFVLEGAERILAKTDYVIFEAWEENCQRFDYSVIELYKWFLDRGFHLRDLVTKENIDISKTGFKNLTNVLATRD